LVYIEFVPDWYRGEAGLLVDYVNVHVDRRFHGDVPVYFYDAGSYNEVIELTGVRACGGSGSEECLEAYRRYIEETRDVAVARYVGTGRFILVDLDSFKSLPRFGRLVVMFHEVLHSVFDGLGLARVYVRLFFEKYPDLLRFARALHDRGFHDAFADVVDSVESVMNELYAVSGEATFLVALRRRCFEDVGEVAGYLLDNGSLMLAVEVLNEYIRIYQPLVGVGGRRFRVSDVIGFYGRVCRDVEVVIDRLPVEDYEYWHENFKLFDGLDTYRMLFRRVGG